MLEGENLGELKEIRQNFLVKKIPSQKQKYSVYN